MTSYRHERGVAIESALAAGEAIRDLYDRSAAATYIKGDGSPVTDADLASDRIIRERLFEAFPSDAILTEEGADDPARLATDRVWVVDPIDGTAQFVARTGEFDVLIALVEQGRPVVGVLLQPTTGRYLAAEIGAGAWIGDRSGEAPLRLQPVPDGAAPRIMTSTWFGAPATMPALSTMAQRLGAAAPLVTSLGIYARYLVPPGNPWDAMIGLTTTAEQTMAWEWDFAAADLVINEAGGRFSDLRGNPHRYNKSVPRNAGGVLFSTDPRTHERLLEAVADVVP